MESGIHSSLCLAENASDVSVAPVCLNSAFLGHCGSCGAGQHWSYPAPQTNCSWRYRIAAGPESRPDGYICSVLTKSMARNASGMSWGQLILKVEVLPYVHRNRGFIRDGSPGRPPRLFTQLVRIDYWLSMAFIQSWSRADSPLRSFPHVILKSGSVLLYVHRDRKDLGTDGEPRTATSTFTQLPSSNSGSSSSSLVLNVLGCHLAYWWQDIRSS